MSRTLLIAPSVILVLVLFCPIIVWSQTASILTVIGTVVDSNGEPVGNGLTAKVENLTTGATIHGITGGISNAYLLPRGISVGQGQFAVVFQPFTSNQAATVGDKIMVQLPELYGDEQFFYTVTKADIDSGVMELRIPYYTFTLSLASGKNLISIPLAEATGVTPEGDTVIINKVSDLGKLLGDSWSVIISYDCDRGKFISFTPNTEPGAPSDAGIDGYTGLIVVMGESRTLELTGKSWDLSGKDLLSGCSNIIGIPLRDDGLVKVSDLAGKLGDSWSVIISYDSNEDKFMSYTRTTPSEAMSNIVIDGDTGLIVVMASDSAIQIEGVPWSDENRRIPLSP